MARRPSVPPPPPAPTALREPTDVATGKVQQLAASLDQLRNRTINTEGELNAAEADEKAWFARAKAVLQRMFTDNSEAGALENTMYYVGGFVSDYNRTWREDAADFTARLTRGATALSALLGKMDVFEAPCPAPTPSGNQLSQWQRGFGSGSTPPDLDRAALEARLEALTVKRRSFTGNSDAGMHGWYVNDDGTVTWLYYWMGRLGEADTVRDMAAAQEYERIAAALGQFPPPRYNRPW